jgi:hypothetical protein
MSNPKYRVISFIVSFTFIRLHNFAFFLISPFNYTYTGLRKEFPFYYLIGAGIGIMLFGSLQGNLLVNKM